MKRTLEIGSNGYYFVDMHRVTESEFYQIKISQQLDDIENDIKEIKEKIKSNPPKK